MYCDDMKKKTENVEGWHVGMQMEALYSFLWNDFTIYFVWWWYLLIYFQHSFGIRGPRGNGGLFYQNQLNPVWHFAGRKLI